MFQRTPNFSVPRRNASLRAERPAAAEGGLPGAPAGGARVVRRRPARLHGKALESRRGAQRTRRRTRWQRRRPSVPARPTPTCRRPGAEDTSPSRSREDPRPVDDPAPADLLAPTGPVRRQAARQHSGTSTFNRDDVTSSTSAPTRSRRSPRRDRTLTAPSTSSTYRLRDRLRRDVRRALPRRHPRHRRRRCARSGRRPGTYLGLATAHFPNLFMVRPGSPAVLATSIVRSRSRARGSSSLHRALPEHGGEPIEPTPRPRQAVEGPRGASWRTRPSSRSANSDQPRGQRPRQAAPVLAIYAGGLDNYRRKMRRGRRRRVSRIRADVTIEGHIEYERRG